MRNGKQIGLAAALIAGTSLVGCGSASDSPESFGARSVLYSVQKGLHAAYLPVSGGSAGTVVIQQVSGAMPCVGDVQAGTLLPSAAGPAVPPLAVTG